MISFFEEITIVNKLESDEAYLKLSNGDDYSTCESMSACLRHVEAVAHGPSAHSVHVKIILSFREW